MTPKYRMNKIDGSGNVITGYEEILTGTCEECVRDYCDHYGFEPEEVLAELVDWEG